MQVNKVAWCLQEQRRGIVGFTPPILRINDGGNSTDTVSRTQRMRGDEPTSLRGVERIDQRFG